MKQPWKQLERPKMGYLVMEIYGDCGRVAHHSIGIVIEQAWERETEEADIEPSYWVCFPSSHSHITGTWDLVALSGLKIISRGRHH